MSEREELLAQLKANARYVRQQLDHVLLPTTPLNEELAARQIEADGLRLAELDAENNKLRALVTRLTAERDAAILERDTTAIDLHDRLAAKLTALEKLFGTMGSQKGFAVLTALEACAKQFQFYADDIVERIDELETELRRRNGNGHS